VREFYWVNGQGREDGEDGKDGVRDQGSGVGEGKRADRGEGKSDLRFQISEDRREEGGPPGEEVRRVRKV